MTEFDQNVPAIALETSGRIGSIAVGRGGYIFATEVFSRPMGQAVELMPALDRLCRSNNIAPRDIQHVYVSGGPGSFTGLRIGVTIARSIALANGARIVRVPTLDAVAQNALMLTERPKHLAVILDAKRKRVFAASFQRDGDAYKRTSEPAEVDPATFFAAMPQGSAVIGEGIAYHQGTVNASGLRVIDEQYARARAEVIYKLGTEAAAEGRFDSPGDVIPIYVRRPEAEEVWEQRQAQETSTESG